MTAIYAWLTHMIEKLTGGLPAEEMEEKNVPLRLDLQFFADEGDDDDDEGDGQGDDGDGADEGEGDDDDTPNLDELLKDPAFKKQYNARLKEQLGKRMKKHERQLEKLKGKGAAGKDQDDDKGADDKGEPNETQAILARAERREKRALVKEYAADNGHNPKLLARLINIDDIELDEDGDPENLEELIEDLEDEFPELFAAGVADDDNEEDERPAKKRYTPGAKQKGNKKKKPDPVAQALADIQRRHGKKKED